MRTRERFLFMVFITMTTVCVSELNVLLVYPGCSKWKYYASEADCRASARSLFPAAHTPLSLSHSLSLRMLCSACGWFALSVKGVVDWVFSRLDCVYGVQSSMCSCLFFLKTHYFSHNLPLFHTSLSLLWQTPRFISWFMKPLPRWAEIG